jgi:hypothetical protein
MTFDTRKILAGQSVVKKLTISLNACKYTQEPYINRELFTVTAGPFSDSYTGSAPSSSISPGSLYFETWGGTDIYAKNLDTGEMIEITITGYLAFNIVSRGAFGTTPAGITSGDEFQIYHKGRADGSCYGYSQTCSSSDSYDPDSIKQLIFSSHPLPSGAIYLPGLDFKSLRYQSPEIKPGESIGSRARLSGDIVDGQHNGYDVVYWPERRSESGTLFGKLMAINPYWQGRKIIGSEGLRDSNSFAEPDWIDRHFIIDSVNLSNERFSFDALDPLILTEGKKAKMPLVSTAQLTGAVTSGSTNITFGNASAGYFGSSGTVIVKIDSELISVTANGTTTMPIVARGYGNSAVKDHSINATVQNCILIENEHVLDLIVYALETWTSVPAAYIDDYSVVAAEIPTKIITKWLISSPMDVMDFINKMIQIGELIFYFDEVTNLIVIKYINQLEISPIYLDDTSHISPKSVKKDYNTKDQFTRFTAAWAPYDLSKTEDNNYQIVLTGINAGMESAAKIGEVNEKKADKFPMLTTSSADYLIAASVIDRVVTSGSVMPEIFECKIDAESVGETQGGELSLGSIVSISSVENQNAAGVTVPVLYQLLKISGDAWASYTAKFKRYQLYEPSSFDFSITAGTYINYVLTDHYSPGSPGEYIVYIESGAIFGSNDTSIAAFDTGTPSPGVTFKLIARWQVLGMGGVGADFYEAGSGSPSDGLDGGIAFEANCNCVIDNGSGLIWAGGGGGGSDTSVFVSGGPFTPFWTPADGGCGGQGFGDAIGGYYTTGATDPATPANDGRGQTGNQSSKGTASGNDGGEWGEAGQNGAASDGGLAGEAIKSNGFTVDIISGDNSLSIRGRRT